MGLQLGKNNGQYECTDVTATTRQQECQREYNQYFKDSPIVKSVISTLQYISRSAAPRAELSIAAFRFEVDIAYSTTQKEYDGAATKVWQKLGYILYDALKNPEFKPTPDKRPDQIIRLACVSVIKEHGTAAEKKDVATPMSIIELEDKALAILKRNGLDKTAGF